MKTPETLLQHWLANVHKFRNKDKTAVRQKDLGIWQRFTWEQEYEQVRNFCLGLTVMGLQRGDRVAILGDNDREYLWGVLAVMAAGGVVVGLFTDVIPAEAEYVVAHSDAVFVLAGDQEQCDKLLQVQANLPLVKKVVYWDDRGMWSYNEPWLSDFETVQRLGRETGADVDESFEALIAAGRAEDPAMFCYTSGTTGLPKGAILSHANFVYAVQAFGEVDTRSPNDNYVSFLPLAWIGGAALDIAPHVVDGVILNFAENPETVRENIREIAPDSLLYNSRLWETLVDTIRARMLDTSWINRTLYRLFLPVGYRVADFYFARQPVPLHWNLLYQIGNLAFFRPLLSQFGLHRARSAFTAGAALSPDVVRFFRALGLPLRQIYGSTEITGGAVIHRRDDVRFESVGQAVPGSQIKILENGEIALTGPGLFLGYHKNPEATDAAFYTDPEGRRWFRTGDAGHLDPDGHLIYHDRAKEMIELARGKRYSPQYIEGRLKFSPYIGQAMTVGDQSHNYVTALITIDFGNVGRWAEKRGLPYTTYADLSQKPEVYTLIRKDVEEVNRTLPTPARVQKFVLLHKEFDADEGEVTRTRKLRRRVLTERYAAILYALYMDQTNVQVRATIQYQDGRQATLDTALRIEVLYGESAPTQAKVSPIPEEAA